MKTLYDLTFPQLAALHNEDGMGEVRARQVFAWLYQKGVQSWDAMTDLPKDYRDRLAAEYDLFLPIPVDESSDPGSATRKFLLQLQDGQMVEAVAIASDRGYTFCLSSQVGCAVACTFCASGRLKMQRNLTPGEIVGQFLALSEEVGRPTNVVYMGMGEPFHNYDNVIASLDLLVHPDGLKFGQRRITVSTSGICPEIYRFADDAGQVNLAISLSGTTDTKRRKVMPINTCYNLRQLNAAIDYYIDKTGRRVTYEYVLLPGVNDTAHDAARLGEMCRDRLVNVNLIPFNPIEPSTYRRPTDNEANHFRKRLLREGVNVTVRWSAGHTIDAACGQLAGRKAAFA